MKSTSLILFVTLTACGTWGKDSSKKHKKAQHQAPPKGACVYDGPIITLNPNASPATENPPSATMCRTGQVFENGKHFNYNEESCKTTLKGTFVEEGCPADDAIAECSFTDNVIEGSKWLLYKSEVYEASVAAGLDDPLEAFQKSCANTKGTFLKLN